VSEPGKGSASTFLQRLCAAVGLVAFFLPALAFALSACVLIDYIALVAAGALLTRMGVLDPARFDVALRLGTGCAVALAVACTAVSARRRLSRPAVPTGPSPPRPPGRTPRRHWSVATIILVLAAAAIASPAIRSGPEGHAVFAGAAIVAACLWIVAVVTAMLGRLLVATLKVAWSASSRSAFAAGICFAGGLGCLAAAVPVATRSARRPAVIRPAPACPGGFEECVRVALISDAQVESSQGSATLSAFGGAKSEDVDDDDPFSKCVAEIYRNNELSRKARLVAASFLGKDDEVDDVFHDTIEAVCQESPRDLEAYFVTAISNRARTFSRSPVRRRDRSCPLEDAPIEGCRTDLERDAATRQALDRARCELKVQEWEILDLVVQGFSYTEIAARLPDKPTPGAVRKRIERARSRFKSEYKRICK
jgi:DNA-directed RNA polymerase specialized sigma24 family protein